MYSIDSSNPLFNSLLWEAGASEQALIQALALSPANRSKIKTEVQA